MLSLDLPGALVKLYTTIKRDAELMAWLGLFLSCFFSAWVARWGAEGAMLLAGQSELMARGGGLVAGATSVLGVLLRSPQARTLLLSLPQDVVRKYQETQGGTIIGPAEGKK